MSLFGTLNAGRPCTNYSLDSGKLNTRDSEAWTRQQKEIVNVILSSPFHPTSFCHELGIAFSSFTHSLVKVSSQHGDCTKHCLCTGHWWMWESRASHGPAASEARTTPNRLGVRSTHCPESLSRRGVLQCGYHEQDTGRCSNGQGAPAVLVSYSVSSSSLDEPAALFESQRRGNADSATERNGKLCPS